MMSKTNQFLAVWDCYGLEYLTNLSEYSKQLTVSILKETEKPSPPPIDQLMLRARMNVQREYEIYSFNAVDDLTEDLIRDAFKENPQSIVNWIRLNGQQIYSDKQKIEHRVIV